MHNGGLSHQHGCRRVAGNGSTVTQHGRSKARHRGAHAQTSYAGRPLLANGHHARKHTGFTRGSVIEVVEAWEVSFFAFEFNEFASVKPRAEKPKRNALPLRTDLRWFSSPMHRIWARNEFGCRPGPVADRLQCIAVSLMRCLALVPRGRPLRATTGAGERDRHEATELPAITNDTLRSIVLDVYGES